jgi:predicted O-linked N-acetylglucosamine transferase (SPINDLY family)
MAQTTIKQAFDQALRHHQGGRLSEAEALYRQVLAKQPAHVGALHYLGVLAHQQGNNHAAVELIGAAINLSPDLPELHNNLGLSLKGCGRLDEAIAAYRRALSIKPDNPSALYNLAVALQSAGQVDDAIAALRQAIALRPGYVEAHNNLGIALKDKGQIEEAIASYRRAIALRPDYAQGHNNLASAFKANGQIDDAIAAYRRAVTIDPLLAEAHNNLGLVLAEAGQLDDAIAAFERAISADPRLAEAHFYLGNALASRRMPDEAAAAFRSVIALQPGHAVAHNNLGNALKERGLLSEAIDAYRRAIALAPRFAEAFSNLLLALHYHPGFDAAAIAREHRAWNEVFATPLAAQILRHDNDRDPDRRLRIGYVSPDFREHTVARFLLPVLANHDRRHFEIFAYANVRSPDAMTALIRTHTDAWHDIAGLGDRQAAERIRADRIDLLVDLAGHTGSGRLLLFARKPAPVQVTYMGYANTTGLATIDYRLTDIHLDPPGVDDSIYSERSIRLPETYWCYTPSEIAPDVSRLPADRNGFVTFCSLNNFCKVTEPAVLAWCRILTAVPNSRLLLHVPRGKLPQNFAELFEHAGIGADRLHLVGRQTLPDYLKSYREADIGLDTFPYTGFTTTFDALWMGVPIVSLAGNSAAWRGGVSILSNLDLAEMVTQNVDGYVQIAIDLANDLPRLGELRRSLRQRMQRSPLMDGARLTRHIEAAYRQMWRNWSVAPSLGNP